MENISFLIFKQYETLVDFLLIIVSIIGIISATEKKKRRIMIIVSSTVLLLNLVSGGSGAINLYAAFKGIISLEIRDFYYMILVILEMVSLICAITKKYKAYILITSIILILLGLRFYKNFDEWMFLSPLSTAVINGSAR